MAAPFYADIAGPNGTGNNMAGAKRDIFVARLADFLTFGDVTATPAAAGDYATITTAHTFAALKGFFKFTCTNEKTDLKQVTNGETDSRSIKCELKAWIAGADPGAAGTFNQLKNDKVIILVVNADGTVWQVGTKDFPAELIGTHESGTIKSGGRGFMLAGESFQPNLLQYGTLATPLTITTV